MHPAHRQIGQYRIGRKHSRQRMGKRLSQNKPDGRYTDGAQVTHSRSDPIYFPCTEIVPDDGLKALVEPDDDHHKYHQHPIDDPVRSDVKISAKFSPVAVFHQTAVDENDHHAGADIHQERRNADTQHPLDDTARKREGLPLEMNKMRLVREVPQFPAHHDDLSRYRRRGRTGDAPSEPEDQQRVEHAVDSDGQQDRRHGPSRIPGSTQHIVQTQINMGNHRRGKNDPHELPRVRDRVFTRSEEIEDFIEENIAEYGQRKPDDDVEYHEVAQDVFGACLIPLPEFYGHQGGCSHADQSTQCGDHVHDGHRNSQSRDGHRPHAMPDKDAVDHVVQRGRQHRNNRRNGIPE